MRQFAACRFRSTDTRTFTYHNDAEPLAPGDFVEVDARGSVKTVEVVSITDLAPEFETKPVIRKVEQDAEAPSAAA